MWPGGLLQATVPPMYMKFCQMILMMYLSLQIFTIALPTVAHQGHHGGDHVTTTERCVGGSAGSHVRTGELVPHSASLPRYLCTPVC